MFRALLSSFTVRDLKPITPITVSQETKVLDVFETLNTRHILSVPVLSESGKVMGVADYYTLLRFIISVLEKAGIILEGEPPTEQKLISLESKILDKTLREVFASSPEPFRTVMPSSTLMEVVRELTTAHRVLVIDESGVVVRIITQTDIARFVGEHLSSIPNANTKSLQQLEIAINMNTLSTVLYVEGKALVLEAAKLMVRNNVSALPVVFNNEIVGHVSASDVDLAKSKSLTTLLKQVFEIAPLSGIVNVSPNASIAEVLTTLNEKKIHHLYIVEDGKQVGLVSLTDIMNIFFSP